ncbi:MAG TPA: hypothetical protein VFB07_06660 [Vicinamibacterales bacterium]|nr:hypothetical protein [Vicinamibacterales bacterium]
MTVFALAAAAVGRATAADPPETVQCAALLDELVGDTADTPAAERLAAWTRRRAADAATLARAIAGLTMPASATDPARQIAEAAAIVRRLVHDIDVVDAAHDRDCAWVPQVDTARDVHD